MCERTEPKDPSPIHRTIHVTPTTNNNKHKRLGFLRRRRPYFISHDLRRRGKINLLLEVLHQLLLQWDKGQGFAEKMGSSGFHLNESTDSIVKQAKLDSGHGWALRSNDDGD